MKIFNVEEPKLGIILYRDTKIDEINIPERLENVLGNSSHDYFKWNQATVGFNTPMPDYRNCCDLKIGPKHWQYLPEELSEIKNIYDDFNFILQQCLKDYESRYNFTMNYMEAINFVKYVEGDHFEVHTDSGFSYFCTLSSVAWFNDDYDGGELWFPYMNLKFKPQKGDILFFPSTYIFAHAALPVSGGIKYSAVTMFNYDEVDPKTSTLTKKETLDEPILRRIDG